MFSYWKVCNFTKLFSVQHLKRLGGWGYTILSARLTRGSGGHGKQICQGGHQFSSSSLPRPFSPGTHHGHTSPRTDDLQKHTMSWYQYTLDDTTCISNNYSSIFIRNDESGLGNEAKWPKKYTLCWTYQLLCSSLPCWRTQTVHPVIIIVN